MHARFERRLRLMTGMMTGGVFGGLLFVVSRGHTTPSDLAAGAVYGVLISLSIVAIELFLTTGPVQDWFGDLSFSATLLLRSALYAAVIIPIQYFELGSLLVGLQLDTARPDFWTATIYSAVFSMLMNLARGIGNLIGPRAFLNFVTGRYHAPVEESRFVLFVDIVGSTGLAERLGGIGIHRFLDRTFRLLTQQVADYRGEVLHYVGDEVIVTWPERVGAIDARPLRCFLAMREALADAAAQFQQEFGKLPEIRGSLHFGPVVVGEIGQIKRAIVFNGDVMNIASRLEQLSRRVEGGFLASHTAIAKFAVSPVPLGDLGRLEIRGRADGIDVMGLA